MSVAVLIPVLARPQRAAPLLDSLFASERLAGLRPVFVATRGDRGELRAIEAARALHPDRAIHVLELPPAERGDYGIKINVAARTVRDEWLFQAADDLRFEPGWADVAIGVAEMHDASVVGTNDMGNPSVKAGLHSTHSLVRRAYVVEHGTIDEPGLMLHEGYAHNYVDNELVETAMSRGQWAFAHESLVEHLHPIWRKGTRDATYERGDLHMREDAELFRNRRRLWR